MSDNTDLNPGTLGDKVVTREISHGGDTAKLQGVFAMGVSGTEGSYTAAAIGGDAANGLDVDVTRSALPTGAATEATLAAVQAAVEGTVTVSGTVELGATALAALETITVASVTAPLAAGTNNIGDVDVLTLPALPAGTNNIGDVDVLSVPADPFGANADASSATGSISAKLRFLAAGIAGATSLPAGTNNIGDVDVLSIVPGTGATSLGKAEDSAHASGDVGVMMLAVRQNSQVDLAADGDYMAPTIDDSGGLRVSIVAGAGSGGTATADDADFTAGTTQGTIVQGVYESTPTSVTDGDVGAVGITQTRAMKVHVASGAVAGLAEDSVAAGGEEGVMLLAVRRDSASSGVSADGDFAALSVTSDGSLRVSGSSGTTQYTEDGASAGGEALCLMGAVRRDTAASSSGTDGDYSTLNVDSLGRLHCFTALTSSAALATITTSIVPGTAATHLGKAEDAAHASGDTGVMALAVRSDTLAASSGTTGDYEPLHTDSVGAQWTRSSGELADDAAFTPATSRVVPAGFFADETASDSVDEGDAGAARMTLDRKQIVTTYAHAAAGGATPYQNLDVDETEDDIKTSPGKLFWVHAINLTAVKQYLKFYNATAANTTVGSTTPVLTFPVPTVGDTNGSGFTINFGDMGVQFDTAICVAATTGFAVADTGAPAANAVILNCGYA